MTFSLFQVDSFTAEPFRGNPAGVCLLDAPRPDDWMLGIAREMNLSETAFLLPEGAVYRLRWFTPQVEVTLCGHATLASAHILWEQGILPPAQTAQFETLSGRLSASRTADGWIRLDFPLREVRPADAPPGLVDALGLKQVRFSGRYREDYLLEADDEEQVRALKPDFARLKHLPARGVVVTARAAPGKVYDFVSRFFAPAVGVDEDPVTGSAHCALAPYWAERLEKPALLAFQASQRGGLLRVRPVGERVLLEGQAVTIFEARLRV
ncbi:MAG: PhzF family phenazine biosynthesis protein [Chloroflexota bacterium]